MLPTSPKATFKMKESSPYSLPKYMSNSRSAITYFNEIVVPHDGGDGNNFNGWRKQAYIDYTIFFNGGNHPTRSYLQSVVLEDKLSGAGGQPGTDTVAGTGDENNDIDVFNTPGSNTSTVLRFTTADDSGIAYSAAAVQVTYSWSWTSIPVKGRVSSTDSYTEFVTVDTLDMELSRSAEN